MIRAAKAGSANARPSDGSPDPPLVSVVITTYNRAQYVGAAIRSALAQSYTSTEIIVIDDGSTDDTERVVAAFVPEVEYVRQENRERGAARNRGFSLASGEYVAFLDSDDIWEPEKLSAEVDAFTDPSIGVVFSEARAINEEGRPIHRRRVAAYGGNVTRRLIRENFVTLSAALIRSSMFREVGGFREERELAGSEDWELWVRLSTRCTFMPLPEVTVRYRVHEGGTMGSVVAMERSMTTAIRIFTEGDYLEPTERRLLRCATGYVALNTAMNRASAGERGRCLSDLGRALVHSPRLLLDVRWHYTLARCMVGSDRLRKVRTLLR